MVLSWLCCCHIEITSLFFTSRLNLCLKWSSDRLLIIARRFLSLQNLLILIKETSLSLSRNFALVAFGKLLFKFSKKENPLYFLYLKVASVTVLLVCFTSLKESTCETRKKNFISLQKLFLFLRYSLASPWVSVFAVWKLFIFFIHVVI